MLETIVPVNPRLRKQALLWGILVAVVGAGGILTLVVYLQRLTASQQVTPQSGVEHVRYVLFLAEAGIVIPVLSLAGMLGYLAMRVFRSGQYPPPEMQVLRDTKIRTGRAAQHAAKICLLFAAVVVLCGVGMGLVMAWALSEPARQSPQPLWQSSALSTLAERTIHRTFDDKEPAPLNHFSCPGSALVRQVVVAPPPREGRSRSPRQSAGSYQEIDMSLYGCAAVFA